MTTGKLAAVAAMVAVIAGAQSFDVVSIHRNLSGSTNTSIHILPGGRISVQNATLKTLIRNAYGILSFELAGEEGWMDGEFYDIEAKTGTGEALTQDRMRPYLQSLLAERFQLKVHWETREANVYALVLDKGGVRMTRNAGGGAPSMNTQKNSGRVQMKGVGVSMATLASNLGNQLGRVVVDQTGLDGVWDFQGSWEIEPGPDSTMPSIFTAVREQLGLRLEAQKGQVKMLAIDAAARATEN